LKKEFESKVKNIKLVITDVDGVLTDGGMYYTKDGDIMKRFHARDGMGVTLLKNAGIPTIILTKEKTEMVLRWSERMKILQLLDGVKNKEQELEKICEKNNLTPQEIAYIGDDVNDLKLLGLVGLSATPNNGIDIAKDICDYVCQNDAGYGAFREFADLILGLKNKN
tara:strand:+ start:6617 stop:7117 length:501 start_codon:yes stop_codon:yes gene_type:complete